jgi:uracil-DNA glycosylase
MNKERRLDILREEWQSCERCGLCQTRKNVVMGDGNPDAKLMIIGEAPGAEEDTSGRPFVGESGEILDTFLKASYLKRSRDVYITNTVACRPFTDEVDLRTGKEYKENRPPSTAEKLACRTRLIEEIYTVDPFLIIALGKTPAQALLGRTQIVTKMRGNVYTLHLAGRHVEIRYPVLVMFHPSYLLRNLDYHSPDGVWHQTGRDFKLATEIIDYINSRYYGIEKEKHEDSEEEDDPNE